MRNILRKINSTAILNYLIVCGIIYFTMSRQPAIVSGLISLSFIFVFSIYFDKCLKNKISPIYIQLIFFSIILVFINVSISGLGGFDYYKKAIMYIVSLIWLVCCSHIKISTKTTYFIVIINIFISLLYIYFYKQGFTIFEGEILLTLNFTNPNQTGMFILNSALYLGIFIFAGKDLFQKKKSYVYTLLICIPLFIFLIQLLLLTGARSCILSMTCFITFVIFDYIFKGIRLKKWMNLLIVILPLLFVFVYVAYIGVFNVDLSLGLDDKGKSNDTRLIIWKPIVDDLLHYIIFGDYYGISGGLGMSQMHNTHLDVLASYGIVPLLLFITILYKILCRSMKLCVYRIQRISLFAFISCLVSCVFESSLVSGSAGLFLLSFGFFMLVNYQKI